jgi:hypothetical protein
VAVAQSGQPLKAGYTVKKVTDWRTARAVYQPRWNTVEFLESPLRESGVVGAALFNLPLNGKWSDLTALFHIFQGGDNLKLKLVELHPM